MLRGRPGSSGRSLLTRRMALVWRPLLLWLLVVPFPVHAVSSQTPDSRQAELRALADTLSGWIIERTGYSETELPDIQFKTQAGLAELCFPGFSHDLLPGIRGAYDARSVVVYLNTDFDSDSLLDLSYLLHELVHHFQVQNVPSSNRASKAVMEARALRMQAEWLEQRGLTDAMEQMGVDEKTLRILEASPR